MKESNIQDPPIVTGNSFERLESFVKNREFSSVFILCDTCTVKLCLPVLLKSCPVLKRAHIITLRNGEPNKTLTSCEKIWKELALHHADRKTLLINLGGGVITDLGGFSASVYKRGVSFIHVPTTLLSMADASIGGKTGFDFLGFKNIIGSFALPEMILINPVFLESLSAINIRNGYAEIFKLALIRDAKFWAQLRAQEAPEIISVIRKSVKIKKDIIEGDLRDLGRRRILNFGHSIGHAIESLSLHRKDFFLHGIAISAGMICESHIAMQKKMLSEAQFAEICSTLDNKILKGAIGKIELRSILKMLRNDKKSEQARMLFSLIKGIGHCEPGIEVAGEEIGAAINYYNRNHA